MLWLPTASKEVVNAAWPEPFNATVPRETAPSRKSTDPVGVPDPPVTVAVKVIEVGADGDATDEIIVVVEVASTAVVIDALKTPRPNVPTRSSDETPVVFQSRLFTTTFAGPSFDVDQ